MKVVNATDLNVGGVTDAEYYSKDGEKLISKGVQITPKHLEALQRRNISQLHMPEGDSELEMLLSKEIRRLGDVELAEAPSVPMVSGTDIPDIGALLPEFRDLKRGRDGLAQIIQSKTVAEFDKKVEKAAQSDKPAGIPIDQRMSQLTVTQRTTEYKHTVTTDYARALKEVKVLLNSLVRADGIEGPQVRTVVERFMKTFVIDKNILLNISGTKQSNGDYIYHHSLNVCLLALNIAAASGYSEPQVIEIGMAGLLHDVGMLLIAPSIRTKTGRLTSDDWFEVQKHPVLGLHLLERILRIPTSATIVAYQAHERENGTGYPRQRNSRLIHRYAKVVQCADIFEAVSSPRSHRNAMTPYAGMETLVRMGRQGFLAVDFIKAFLMYASMFPVGSIVELSDKSVGRVIQSNGTSFTKPVVSVLVNPKGTLLGPGEVYQVDLKVTHDLQISKSHRYDYLENPDIMQGF